MRKRHAPEPFNPGPHGTWLVVRDSLSRVVETSALNRMRICAWRWRPPVRLGLRNGGIARPSGHSWRSSSARARACATGWVSSRVRHRGWGAMVSHWRSGPERPDLQWRGNDTRSLGREGVGSNPSDAVAPGASESGIRDGRRFRV